MMVPENLPAYILEGLIVGLFVASMTGTVSYISEITTGDEDDKRVFWISNLIIAMIAHVIAESFRHTRIVALLKTPIKTPSFKQLGTALRRNARRLSISDLPQLNYLKS